MIPAALTFPLPRWVTHKLENNYITRVLPTGVSSEPHFRLPAWGSDVRRSGPQRFGFKSQRECRLSTGRGEVRLSWRTYTRSCVSRTQGKSSDFIGTYIRPTCGLGGSPEETGVSCDSLSGHRHWWQAYWVMFNHMKILVPDRLAYSYQDLVLPNIP